MARTGSEVTLAGTGFQSTWIWASADHPGRYLIEDFIRECFFAEYKARICHFLSNLLGLVDEHGIHAAVGFAGALHRELYLEQYLDCPVELTLYQAAGIHAERARIVEVGNLAASSPGGARAVILALARYFHEQDAVWVVFTGVPSLLNTFSRLGIPVHELGEARQEKLRDRDTDWGTYYHSHPRVMAVSVAETFRRIEASPVLSRMLARLPRLNPEVGLHEGRTVRLPA